VSLQGVDGNEPPLLVHLGNRPLQFIGSTKMMTTLTQLLQPYPLERFLSDNWTQHSVIIPGNSPDKFKHLFSWEQLNHLLNFHQLEPRFVLNDQALPPCDPKDWVTRCQQGASLVLSQIQTRVPTLADLVWAMQQETGHKAIHTNIYCSWPSKQGFKIHYDAHEVFVMQIDGVKEWFVFEDTVKHPYRDEKSDHQTPPDSEPYLHCVLQPGDLLYIPRGHWHYAIAREQPSLHVTLGIRCFNGRDLLEWVTKLLHDTLPQEEVWRQNLPLIVNENTDALTDHVQNLFNILATKMTEEKENFTQTYVNFQPQITTFPREISLPGQAGFSPFEKGLDTVLRQPKFQTITIEPLDNTGYLLITPQKKLRFKGLPSYFMNTLVEKLLTQQSFMIREVTTGLNEHEINSQILPLLAGLVQEGILLEVSSKTVVNSQDFKWSVGTVQEKQAKIMMER
jgi:ribosomal protein L16 Arg81 hydroxylase